LTRTVVVSPILAGGFFFEGLAITDKSLSSWPSSKKSWFIDTRSLSFHHHDHWHVFSQAMVFAFA
jgi:hypothetical protein